MMEAIIVFVISNFTLSLFILSVIVITIALICKTKPVSKEQMIDIIFSYFLLINIGLSYLYNFVMHVFFGDLTASFIGWQQSPFQLEVGFASLGFAMTGILSFWSGFGFRAATILAPSLFLWGAAGGHIYQMIIAHNFTPGNSGMIFWSDIFIPVIGLTLLYLQYRNPVRGF